MMLRRLLLAALIALAPSLASAQFATIGPTPPTSDNGDRLATTAWTNLWAASAMPLASGKIWIGSAGNIAVAQTPSGDCTITVGGVVTCTQSAGAFTVNGTLTVAGTIIDSTNGIVMNNPTGGSKGAGTINISADYYKNGTIIPETVSAPLSLVSGLLSCPTCVLISGTAHGDSAYSILSTDRYVYTNAAFTAARTWTLPAANSLTAGTTIWVQDAQGTVTTTNTLTIQRAGADTINVSGTNIVMTGAGGGTQFTTDGVSNWGTAVQTVTTGGTGRQTLTNHGVLVGAATNPLTQLAVGANGQLLLGSTGADPAFGTMSQDCTITSAGVITCTKTNNVAFATSATTDTTNATNISSGTLPTARLSLGQITNSLGADVAVNVSANYFDGPSVAQGSTGTWFASGTITMQDPAINNFYCKLWDGTTVIASGASTVFSAGNFNTMSLSGFLASPAGNLRISCRSPSTTTAVIKFNLTGNSKDSTITAFRVQ